MKSDKQQEAGLPQPSQLTTLFIRGVMWYGGSTAITAFLRIGVIAFLARLLSPEDFGLFSVTLLLIGFGDDLGDLGMGPAIIQKQKISQKLLSTIFWMVMLAGMAFFLAGVISAPVFAWFFKEDLLRDLIMVASISFIFRSSAVVHHSLLKKELDFGKIALLEMVAAIVFSGVTLVSAFQGFGVWSLVYGFLASRISQMILAWQFCPFRPQFHFAIEECRDVFHFGFKIIGERISYFFSSRMDYILIGHLLGTQLLGYYTLAAEPVNMVYQKISGMVSQVAFSAFSKTQHNVDRVRWGYRKMNKTLSLFNFPVLAGLTILAGEFVNVFYGPGWEQVVLPLQILCGVGAIRSLMNSNGSILYALNRPDLAFKWGIIQMVTIPVPVWIGSFYGLPGIAVSLLITFLFYFVYMQNVINSLINERFFLYIRLFGFPFLASLLMFLTLLLFKNVLVYFIPNWDGLVLGVGIGLGLTAYVIFIRAMDKTSWTDFKLITQNLLTQKA